MDAPAVFSGGRHWSGLVFLVVRKQVSGIAGREIYFFRGALWICSRPVTFKRALESSPRVFSTLLASFHGQDQLCHVCFSPVYLWTNFGAVLLLFLESDTWNVLAGDGRGIHNRHRRNYSRFLGQLGIF